MRPTRASQATRFILIVTALLLPTLSLLPLGGLYLFEKGWLLWWAFGAAGVVTLVYLTQRFLLASPEFDPAQAGEIEPPSRTASAANPMWTSTEQRAWADVQAIAARVNPEKLDTSKAIFDLGHHTVNAVAKRMHPTKSDALWQFTMPEALAITERVSQRLGRFVEDTIPFGDRLTVSQVLAVYSWRSVADVAGKAYDIWRIVRLVNPAAAVTNEARERLSRAMLAWGKDHVSRQLAETFVLEVGRAAIDLYGGRLRVSRDDILENRIDASALASGAGGGAPLRVLVTGPARGRVPIVAATLEAMRAERADKIAAFVRGDTSHSDVIALTAVDVIPVDAVRPVSSTPSARDIEDLTRDARMADIVIWTQNGLAPPDDYDARGLRAINSIDTPVPPVLLPLIYPAANDGDSAALNDERVLMRALEGLHTGYVSAPLLLRTDAMIGDPSDALWTAIGKAAAEARRVQFARSLDSARNRRDWTGAARQAASAAGALAKSMLPGRSGKA